MVCGECHERAGRAGRACVEGLFDQYAADFDAHLVEQLRRRSHEWLLRPRLAPGRRYRSVLDPGCGTGLCGERLRPMPTPVGIDALGEPGEAHPQYGRLWWMSRRSGRFPFAPESSIFAPGGENHLIRVDRELELVVISRWIRAEQCGGLVERIVAGIAA